MTSREDKQVEDDNDDAEKVTDEAETNLLENVQNIQNGYTEGGNSISGLDPTNGKDKVNRRKKNGFRDIILNIRQDSLYRQKFVHTCILWWSFFGLGWVVGMSGPTFPDLRQIINEDLATASWMFPAWSFGTLVGAFVSGILFDRYNKILLLAFSTLGMGVSIFVTPFCATLPWMLFVKVASGIFGGGLDVGGNSYIMFIWGQDGESYMQALHFGFSLGASFSPYVTGSFLAKKIKSCSIPENMTQVIMGSNNSTIYNNSMTDIYIVEDDNHNATPEVVSHVTDCTERYENSSVYIAFIIAGLIILSCTFSYTYLYIKTRQNQQDKQKRVDDVQQDRVETSRRKLRPCTKIFCLALLGILLATNNIIEDGFANYLMTFAIERLKWGKTTCTGSFATGLFWTSFGAGRFIGIFTIACCHATVLLTSHFAMLGCAFIGFLLSIVYYVDFLIWVFTVILGLSMSVIFPAVLSWTCEHIVEVTGKISAYFRITASLSSMVCLFLIGNMMDKYDPMWFVYIMVAVLVTCLISYGVLNITLKLDNYRSSHDHVSVGIIVANGQGGAETDIAVINRLNES